MKKERNTTSTRNVKPSEYAHTASQWWDEYLSHEHITKTNTDIRKIIRDVSTLSRVIKRKELKNFVKDDAHSLHAFTTMSRMHSYLNNSYCSKCNFKICEHNAASSLEIIMKSLLKKGYFYLKIPKMRNWEIEYSYTTDGRIANEVQECLLYTVLDDNGEPFIKFIHLTSSEYYVHIDGRYIVDENISQDFLDSRKYLQRYKYYSYHNGMLSNFNEEPALQTNLIISHWNDGELLYNQERPSVIGYIPALSDEARKYRADVLSSVIKNIGKEDGIRTPKTVLWRKKDSSTEESFIALTSTEDYEVKRLDSERHINISL
jgi:hypothetical protein